MLRSTIAPPNRNSLTSWPNLWSLCPLCDFVMPFSALTPTDHRMSPWVFPFMKTPVPFNFVLVPCPWASYIIFELRAPFGLNMSSLFWFIFGLSSAQAPYGWSYPLYSICTFVRIATCFFYYFYPFCHLTLETSYLWIECIDFVTWCVVAVLPERNFCVSC